MFNSSVKNYGNLPCLGWRVPLDRNPNTGVTAWSEYRWKTYNEVSACLLAGLLVLGTAWHRCISLGNLIERILINETNIAWQWDHDEII